MDRPIIYSGAVPLDTDLLRLGRYAKEGFGRFAEMLFGSQAIRASGLDCKPAQNGLAFLIGPGSIMAPYALDSTRIGTVGAGLEADTRITQCQFFNDVTCSVPVPLTGADLTLYALCREIDDLTEILPFYNAEAPDQTMAGPDNRGSAVPCRRTGRIIFTMATSPPAEAGTVVVPLYRMQIPAGAENVITVRPQATEVFAPLLSDYATTRLVQQISGSQSYCGSSRLLPIPSWSGHVELRVIGAGGGGASARALTPDAGQFSGAGGGGGAEAWGIYGVDPTYCSSLSVTIGLGGASDGRGGASLVTYDGHVMLSAEGGAAGNFVNGQSSVGGSGGEAMGGAIWDLTGGGGSDGQYGALVFAGHGADGPWGGAGRAGHFQGRDATRHGAGGGGACGIRNAGDVAPGGRGFQGCVIYRFLL